MKVEATKYTEVGYYGRDVESLVRDLVEAAGRLVREGERERVADQAKARVEQRLLDLLLPAGRRAWDATDADSPRPTRPPSVASDRAKR